MFSIKEKILQAKARYRNSDMLSIKKRILQAKTRLRKNYEKDDCKTISCDNPDVTEILKKGIGNKKYRIATAGYSYEQEGYAEVTTKFIKALDRRLGHMRTGYITSPSLSEGSIYDITTQVSGLGASNVAYFTTEEYWENTQLNDFREDLNMRRYSKTPIYLFPDTETYIDATANASNILICTGGKDIAVAEIIAALKRKNKVVLLINEKMKKEGFDRDNQRVENSAQYFLDYAIHCQSDLPASKQLDLEFLKSHPGRHTQLLNVYVVEDDKSIASAAERAAYFIKRETLYDFWPDKTDYIDKAPSWKYSYCNDAGR